MHGVVKTALLYYLKMSAGTKHIQEATKGDLIVTAFVLNISLFPSTVF